MNISLGGEMESTANTNNNEIIDILRSTITQGKILSFCVLPSIFIPLVLLITIIGAFLHSVKCQRISKNEILIPIIEKLSDRSKSQLKKLSKDQALDPLERATAGFLLHQTKAYVPIVLSIFLLVIIAIIVFSVTSIQ